jgi:hypothetical protein
MGDLYPNLGFDPCPGDLAGYEALAAYATRSAATLTAAARTLASAGSEQWRGQAADAFRTHVQADVLPLASGAAGSLSRAAAALQDWSLTLAGLQNDARALDQQAAPYQVQLTAVLRSAGLPATARPPYPASRVPRCRPAHRQPAHRSRQHGTPAARPVRQPLARRDIRLGRHRARGKQYRPRQGDLGIHRRRR